MPLSLLPPLRSSPPPFPPVTVRWDILRGVQQKKKGKKSHRRVKQSEENHSIALHGKRGQKRGVKKQILPPLNTNAPQNTPETVRKEEEEENKERLRGQQVAQTEKYVDASRAEQRDMR